MEDVFWETVLEAVGNAKLDSWRIVRVRGKDTIIRQVSDMPLPRIEKSLKELTNEELSSLSDAFNSAEIGKMIGEDQKTVLRRIRSIQQMAYQKRLVNERYEKLDAMLAAGVDFEKIGDELGMTTKSVRIYAKRKAKRG